MCGLLASYRPDLLQLPSLPWEPERRWRLALGLLQTELGVSSPLSPERLAVGAAEPEQLLELLSRLHDSLHGAPAAAPRTAAVTVSTRQGTLGRDHDSAES